MNRSIVAVVAGVSIIVGTMTLLAACSSEGNPSTNLQADASSPEAGTVDGPPTPRSGSRLRIVRYKAAGNAYAESSLRDTELGPCTPMYLTDGSIRCAPAPGGARLVFSDSGCTQPFALGGAQCASSFAISGLPTGVVCDTPSTEKARVWAVKAPIPAPVEYYEPSSTDGTCTKYSVWEGAGTYAVEELPPSQMVALERKDENAGRVALRLLTSEDGLRYPLGLADVATGKSCSLTARNSDGQAPTNDESTVVPCIPGVAATSPKFASSGEYVQYADSNCTTAAAAAGEDACTSVPSFVRAVTIPPDACATPTVTNHAVGPQLSSRFSKSGDTCSAKTVPPGNPATFWAVGEPLDLSSFAPVNRTLIGEGKARSVTYAVDGKTLFEGEGSFRHGTTHCSPMQHEDTTYCIPFGVLATPPANGPGPYADADCTRLAVMKMIPTPCSSTPLVAEFVLPTGGCTPGASLGRVFDLGAPIASIYMRAQGGGCQAQQGFPGGPTYYEIGAERNPADVFATLERTEL